MLACWLCQVQSFVPFFFSLLVAIPGLCSSCLLGILTQILVAVSFDCPVVTQSSVVSEEAWPFHSVSRVFMFIVVLLVKIIFDPRDTTVPPPNVTGAFEAF